MSWPGERQRHSMSARGVHSVVSGSRGQIAFAHVTPEGKLVVIDNIGVVRRGGGWYLDYYGQWRNANHQIVSKEFIERVIGKRIDDMMAHGFQTPMPEQTRMMMLFDLGADVHEIADKMNKRPEDVQLFFKEAGLSDLEMGWSEAPSRTWTSFISGTFDEKLLSIKNSENLPVEIKEDLDHEYKSGRNVDMDVNQAIQSAAEHVADKWDSELDEEGVEIGYDTYKAMEVYLLKERNIRYASGKKYESYPVKYSMPLGSLQQPLNLQDGSKVKIDLDGTQLFSGTVNITESDRRRVVQLGYNPDEVVAVTFWRGRVKNYDLYPKDRIVAVKHPGETKFTTVREWQKDRQEYSTIQVVET